MYIVYREYLKIKEIKNYDLGTVEKAVYAGYLFENDEEAFKICKEKEFKAYYIELTDAIRNEDMLRFLKSKYSDISNPELARLTEFLFVSDINELSRLDKNDMLNKKKGFKFAYEIWSQFIEDIENKTKLFLYQYNREHFVIEEVIQQNNLSHILKPIGEDIIIEYNNSWINHLGSKSKLIELIPFDIYVLGFNKETSNYDFSKENIKNYRNNVDLLMTIDNDLGHATLLVNKHILI